jgi:hypothetical protein
MPPRNVADLVNPSGVFRVPDGAFLGPDNKLHTINVIAGLESLAIEQRPAARNRAVKIDRRSLVAYTFPGVPVDAAAAWLLHIYFAADTSALNRLGALASLLKVTLPDHFASIGSYNGADVIFKAAPPSVCNFLDGTATDLEWESPGDHDLGKKTVLDGPNEAGSGVTVELARVFAGLMVWALVRVPVAQNADLHVGKRQKAVLGIIGEDVDPDSIAGDRFPQIEQWIDAYKAGAKHRHFRAAIVQAACAVADLETDIATDGFAQHVRMLECYGLGNFNAIMAFINAMPTVVADHQVLVRGAMTFDATAFEEWLALSPHKRKFWKAIADSDWVPLRGLRGHPIIAAGKMYRRAMIPGLSGMEVGQMPEGLKLYLEKAFAAGNITLDKN